MSTLHVCPLSRLHATVEETRASHIVTLIGENTVVERPICISADRHLFITVSDIAEPAEGLILPAHSHATPGSAARPRPPSSPPARSRLSARRL
jgi:predicted protein tyrosine phosphatase